MSVFKKVAQATTMLMAVALAQVVQSGELKLTIQNGNTQYEQQLVALLEANLPELVGEVNDNAHFRENVYLLLAPSTGNGEPDAFYSTDTNVIFVGYDIIFRAIEEFGGVGELWYPIVEHLVLHELGHALVDVNQLDLNGINSEVAADQLAFMVMSLVYEDATELVSVTQFFESLKNTDVSSISEHLPNQQRAEDYFCWIVGKEIAEANEFGEEIDECETAYNRLMNSWERRLAPYLKDLE